MATLNEHGIACVTAAGSIIDKIFRTLNRMRLVGKTTLEINDAIDALIRQHGGQPTFLHYRGFPRSACISLNHEVVHGIPDDREVKDGDLVKIDIGVTYQGFIADAACTFAAGRVRPAARALMKVTWEALQRGLAQTRNGNCVSDISRAIQEHVEANGCSVVRELTGHGVGRRLHEEPMIPNFVWDGPDFQLTTGMGLAIEPMVNAGGHEVLTERNGWTVSSRDHSLSCHYEDTVVILPNGILNTTRVAEQSYGA